MAPFLWQADALFNTETVFAPKGALLLSFQRASRSPGAFLFRDSLPSPSYPQHLMRPCQSVQFQSCLLECIMTPSSSPDSGLGSELRYSPSSLTTKVGRSLTYTPPNTDGKLGPSLTDSSIVLPLHLKFK